MSIEKTPAGVVPYYTEMENIMARLTELNKMDYPHKRSHYASDGQLITEDVLEYLEEKKLLARWNNLRDYDRALSSEKCKNGLLVSLRLDLLAESLKGRSYDPTTAARIAISVYRNSPARW